ncbi:DUF3422 domain-containing protein [Thiohalocapsa marina]|uniref:DUF3422 domain-containing protein n=1 Tax=Thiohalocapsa marina TaxID=424902 RepID=A0A5M8FR84_9GAMM|nr:DUF3422 domain-containing protein [Thiohalocapsa marina]KAA6183672.1 DUF3422 domain-containing protein [Thiohalocapsa marina]
MPSAYPQHPLRHELTSELHVRTFEPIRAPTRLAHLVYQCGERGSGINIRHLERLLTHFGVPAPSDPGQQFYVDIGELRLRWERHTEFVTYTFFRPGPFERPFADTLLDTLPANWLQQLPGRVVSAILLALESREHPEHGLGELTELFGGNPVIGAEVAGGAGIAWSDMRIHPDGFGRMLLRDINLSDGQAGRLIKRILDVDAYRAMALLGLPPARKAAAILSEAEQQLADLALRMTANPRPDAARPPSGNDPQAPLTERALLNELTSLATEVESVTARTTSRFDASRAYHQVMRQRLEQLRERRIQGLQTFTEFLEARVAPAIATCAATGERQQALAERAARMTALLRARVELQLQEQNRSLLDSMDRRARLQLRLQETVEGLSVVAISYYGLGLVGYLLKGLGAGGLPIDADLAIALALPLVVGAVWLGLQRAKRKLLGKQQAA